MKKIELFGKELLVNELFYIVIYRFAEQVKQSLSNNINKHNRKIEMEILNNVRFEEKKR